MRQSKVKYGFMLFVLVVCLAAFILDMINGRFWLADFRVYYSAVKNLISGGPVYGISYDSGSGFYKYSPVILFFYLPYLLFSYKIASIIHFFILGFSFWYTFKLIFKIVKKYFFGPDIKHGALILSLSFICILIHFTREMHLGNINIILLLLCCLALKSYLEDKPMSGSLFFGLVLLAKPFYLLLIIPLIVRKNWKALGWLCLVLACGGLLPFVTLGFNTSLNLYSGWIKTMLDHGQGYPGMCSLDYILRYTVFNALPDYAGYIIMLLTCGFAVWFISANVKDEHKKEEADSQRAANFSFEWLLLISLLPVLFKTDWVQLLLSAPLITFILFRISETKKYWIIPLLIIVLFFFSSNSDDLLGKELSHKILITGLMGLSNIILVGISIFMFLDFRKKKIF